MPPLVRKPDPNGRPVRNLQILAVTDTIPLSDAAREIDRIRQLSIAELLGETMRRVYDNESVSSLFVD